MVNFWLIFIMLVKMLIAIFISIFTTNIEGTYDNI